MVKYTPPKIVVFHNNKGRVLLEVVIRVNSQVVWFNERGYFMVVVILVEFDFGLKVIGVESFLFNPKNVEG